eukprot:340354_1
MALTNEKDSSSDDGVMVEKEVELSEQLADEGLLTAEKLDAHNNKQQQNHPTPNDEDDNKNNIEDNSSEVNTSVGAGLIFALPCLLIGGPVLGTIAFISGFLVARDDTEGEAGNVARNAGTFAIDTGSTIGQSVKEANEKHGILDKIKNAFASTFASSLANLKKYDEEKELSKKTMETASQVKDKTMEFEQKHHVMENILQSLQKFSTNMLEKLRTGK